MTRFSTTLFLVLVCAIIYASAADTTTPKGKGGKGKGVAKGKSQSGQKKSGRMGGAVNPKMCAPIMAKMESCCNAPKVITRPVFQGCVNENGLGAEGSEGRRGKSGGASGKKTQKKVAGVNGGGGGGGGKGGEHKKIGGPMCIMECVMRNNSMLDTAGEIIADKVAQEFAAVSNADWKPIVTKAVAECAALVAGRDKSKDNDVKPPKVYNMKICNPAPAFFMTCLRKKLVENCAPVNKTTDATLKAECAKDEQKLKDCDPLLTYKPTSFNNMKVAASAHKGGKGGAKSADKAKSGKVDAKANKGKKEKAEKADKKEKKTKGKGKKPAADAEE